eukprot:TRINITY_DN2136_c0_g1_i1.p1 TRINITY_DN2136_c0_g1~~TRINITY_DN2136_c0_g1_i1.p1  ORF type:complete len:135 (+),score=36.90 TRINITY_DN2136_c0_g1_i1:117-521(+)
MLIENPLTTEELNRFLAWRETRATQPTTSKAEKGRKEEEKMKKWSKPNAQRFVRPAEYEPISTGTKNIPTDVQSPSDFLMLLFDDEAIQHCVDEINIILSSERSVPFVSTRSGQPRKKQRGQMAINTIGVSLFK